MSKSFCTIKLPIGPLSPDRQAAYDALSPEEKREHKKKVDMQVNKQVPLGPYPCLWKGCGWVKLWFHDDCVLRYTFYKQGIGLDIAIESKRASGTVTMLGRSEVYDAKTGSLKLQPDFWKKQVSVTKAKQIVRQEKKNWPLYIQAMMDVEKKSQVNVLSPSLELASSCLLDLSSRRPKRRTRAAVKRSVSVDSGIRKTITCS